MNFKDLCESLEQQIINAYSESITLEEAEKLAGQFLHAQMKVSVELKKASLDARMRKSGVKAIRAAIYLEICSKADKKPTETAIESMINTTKEVNQEQEAFDIAEVESEELERYYNIFQQAHVYFRQMSRGVQG